LFKNIFKQIDPIIKNEIKIINNNSKDFACFMLICCAFRVFNFKVAIISHKLHSNNFRKKKTGYSTF